MKKSLPLLLIILISFALFSCNSKSNTQNAEIDLGTSSKFSEEEIQNSINKVIEKFSTFENCELTKLWYEEQLSIRNSGLYLSNGKGANNGSTIENTIVIFSEFKTNSKAGGGWTTNTNYYWNWTLIREDNESEWVVDDYGY